MNKAFLFDMDGVLLDSENVWRAYEEKILERLVSIEVRAKMGNLVGLGARSIHEKAVQAGHTIDFETLVSAYDRVAPEIYSTAKITPGIGELVETLSRLNFKLGIVTASPMRDVKKVLSRIPEHNRFEVIVSLGERHDLRPKPSPDGYIEALKNLSGEARMSIILEDSNYGIAAGKAAGAFVIGFRGNIVPGHEQNGADTYADTMEEVGKIAEQFIRQ